MTASAVKQKPNAGIAIPIAASAVGGIGIAIAPRVVRDDALGLLRDGFAFVSALSIGAGLSPATAGVIAVVLFLAGVVSGL